MKDTRIAEIKKLAELMNAHGSAESSTADIDALDDLDRILHHLRSASDSVKAPVIRELEPRLTEVIEVISDYASLRYSSKASASGTNDILDALAAGVNMLGEELKASTISRTYLDNILKGMQGLVFVVDLNGSIQMVNTGAITRLGYSEAELIGMEVSTIVASIEQLLFNGEVGAQEIQTTCLAKNGDTFPISFSASAFQNKPGDAPSLVCVAHDVTDRKEAADKLKESEYLFRSLVATMNDGVMLVDQNQNVQYVNEHFLEITGYELVEIVARNAVDLFILEEDSKFVRASFAERLKGETARYELPIRNKKGELIWMSLSASPVRNIAGDIIGSMVVHTDISLRKMTELQLQNSISEKEMLIKEVHHRVKNNLQVISSLLSLQSTNVDNETANAILRESQNRIKSMAIIHEKLYQSKNLSSIDFQEYTGEIVNQLRISYGIDVKEITINSLVNNINLGVDLAVPCGLILNELVSNAIKYAFPGEHEGKIGIMFEKSDDDVFKLSVSDDGVGFPEDIDFRDTTSLGLQLVITLTEQLDGEITLENSGGTCFHISFKAPI
jgi:PAS domain S-box-containing protein